MDDLLVWFVTRGGIVALLIIIIYFMYRFLREYKEDLDKERLAHAKDTQKFVDVVEDYRDTQQQILMVQAKLADNVTNLTRSIDRFERKVENMENKLSDLTTENRLLIAQQSPRSHNREDGSDE